MSQSKFNPAYTLSALIAVLAAAASAGGFFINGLYRDNPLVTSGWYGNDLVTLLVAVPVLVAALIPAMRGSQRARLVWLGMLDYTLYNFAFYLFGAALNSLFLVYVALFTLSIFALIFGLASLDVKDIGEQFRASTPVKWISGYMLLVALFLGGFHTAISISYIFTGRVPEMIVAVGHPTNVIAALDLSTVVSVYVLGAIWLWKRQPWGYVLAVIANVKGAVYMLALAASTVSAVQAGTANDLTQAALWGSIGVACLIASVFLLGNLKSANK
jgi:hypothetical protein